MAQRFKTRVEPHQKTATFFHVPPKVVEKLGPKKRVPVRVTVNGHTYRSTIAPMGGEYLLPLNRGNREAAGVEAGEMVTISIERDDEPRVVTVPKDLKAAFAKDAKAKKAFGALSYSHQRECVEWIADAKRPETRARRVEQTVEKVVSGPR